MASDLHVDLDQVGRKITKIRDEHHPLPSDVDQLLKHAFDDLLEARGKERFYDRIPGILGHFDVGDRVQVIVQAFSGENGAIHQQQSPISMSAPDIMAGVVLRAPAHRSPNDYEKVDDKMWYFTSDLPVSVACRVDATMHLELPSDRREVFHLEGENWATWHEKNGTYWSVLTIFRDHAPRS